MGTSQPDRHFDTKIAVLLRDDLESWQSLNVTAFLVSGLGQREPDVIGRHYIDADANEYLPMFGQPVVILQGDRETLTSAHSRILRRGLTAAIYTADLFSTGNDDDNRAAVHACAPDKLDLVGLALHGRRNVVDRCFKGARMHP